MTPGERSTGGRHDRQRDLALDPNVFCVLENQESRNYQRTVNKIGMFQMAFGCSLQYFKLVSINILMSGLLDFKNICSSQVSQSSWNLQDFCGPPTHYGNTKNLLWEETLISLDACGEC